MNRTLPLALAGLALAACAPREESHAATPPVRMSGEAITVRDTTLPSTFEASGVAAAYQQAMLSTKLMGTVTAVLVREGDLVAAGQPLVRIDARDIAAKSAQVSASIAEAEAMHRDALAQATRIRGLYADSAATRAQLDGVEAGLARAEAGVRAAHAGSDELGALSSYATVRAPFAGVVTARHVDPGAFAAPGAPLIEVQDQSRLRVSANAAPDAVRALRRGSMIAATIEGAAYPATVEGVVPSAGNLYAVNAIVTNARRAILANSAATLSLSSGAHRTVFVPAAAVRREGDLTGVVLRTAAGDEMRWVRLGPSHGTIVEVTGGLQAGDVVILPVGSR